MARQRRGVVNVSGPNRVPVPSEHPNDDLLADLAAEVLAADLAGSVRDHVVGCSRCAALLADAEGVRSMLLQIEPEQMPNEVLARLEQAMQVARQEDEISARAGVPELDGSETRILGRVDSGETRILGRVPPLSTDSGRADPGRRIPRAGGLSAAGTGRAGPAGSITGPLVAGGPKTSRLSRMSTPTQSARRQAIEEQKADRPSRLAKLWPGLRIAAVVIVVVGAGAGALQLRGDGTDGADSAATSAADAPVIAPVQSTKTDYTKKALRAQVKTLIDGSQKLLAEPQPQTEANPDNSFAAKAEPSAGTKVSGTQDSAAQAPLGEQGQLLRSPAALRECLTAIGAAQVEPVAVDLAKYAGREAAIIVLPADGGGYDVWVVARDCRADSDGAIDVVNVKP